MKYIQRNIWIIIVIIVAILGLVAWGFARIPSASRTDHNAKQTQTSSVQNDFDLINQEGMPVNDRDFKGQWQLVFFGFSYCPEICPTTLGKITRVMEELGPLAEKIQPILISIDPQRDTPERLKEYLADYHPKMMGLTGTEEQLKEVAAGFKVYYSKIENPHMGDAYMFDHSTYTYLFRPDGYFETFFGYNDTIDSVVTEIKSYIK